MSELIKGKTSRESIRRNLLTNVSVLALLGYLSTANGAMAGAADSDAQPTVWIELGGQVEEMTSTTELFAPPFVGQARAADRNAMMDEQKAPKFSIGGEGKIAFTPSGSNWVLSAGILYGRSNGAKHTHQQTAIPYLHRYLVNPTYPYHQPQDQIFGDGQAKFNETHAVIDFRAGKDVGLGMFGASGKSILSAGVRFAQFTSSSDVTLNARPDYRAGARHHGSKIKVTAYGATQLRAYQTYDLFRHTNAALLRTKRNTHAFGPSISWDASAPVAGSNPGMTVALDWGITGAVLFGRQRAAVHHQTSGQYNAAVGPLHKYPYRHYVHSSYVHGPINQTRVRNVTIPNVGGFAGASFRYLNAKLSVGYRADFFFGAVDNGIDTAQKTNIGFYGPFATISIGIGG